MTTAHNIKMFSKPMELSSKKTISLPLCVYNSFLISELTSRCANIVQYFLCRCWKNKKQLAIASVFRIMCIKQKINVFLGFSVQKSLNSGMHRHVHIVTGYKVLHYFTCN